MRMTKTAQDLELAREQYAKLAAIHARRRRADALQRDLGTREFVRRPEAAPCPRDPPPTGGRIVSRTSGRRRHSRHTRSHAASWQEEVIEGEIDLGFDQPRRVEHDFHMVDEPDDEAQVRLGLRQGLQHENQGPVRGALVNGLDCPCHAQAARPISPEQTLHRSRIASNSGERSGAGWHSRPKRDPTSAPTSTVRTGSPPRRNTSAKLSSSSASPIRRTEAIGRRRPASGPPCSTGDRGRSSPASRRRTSPYPLGQPAEPSGQEFARPGPQKVESLSQPGIRVASMIRFCHR